MKGQHDPLVIQTKCKIDGIEFPSKQSVKRHLHNYHHIRKPTKYYEVLNKKEVEGFWSKLSNSCTLPSAC